MFYLEHFSVGKNGIEFKDKMGRNLSLEKAMHKIMVRFYSYLEDIDLLVIRLVGFIPVYFIRLFFYTLDGVKIGKNAHIHMGAQFFKPRNVEIGEGTIIGQNAFLDGRDKLKIGNHVDIASDVMIYNSEHEINSEDFVATLGPVEIGDFVFIGPRVIILPGVKIGKGAVVAAGAVVVKSVEDFEIVGGVPARVIGVRKSKDPHYRLGRSRLFQ